MSGEVVRRSRIDGEFDGFDDEKLFLLADGTAWLQGRYRYWYHYAYMPEACIVRKNGHLHIDVCGKSVEVRQTQVHFVGTLDGEFKGWDGSSVYRLTNGQVWEQTAYKYEYKYAYRPEAIVYEASSGTLMAVEGTVASVRRVT